CLCLFQLYGIISLICKTALLRPLKTKAAILFSAMNGNVMKEVVAYHATSKMAIFLNGARFFSAMSKEIPSPLRPVPIAQNLQGVPGKLWGYRSLFIHTTLLYPPVT